MTSVDLKDQSPKVDESSEGSALTDQPPSEGNALGRQKSPVDSGRGLRPSMLFFGIVSAISLVADIGSKVWAELLLNRRGHEPMEVLHNHLSITLAYNPGGAFGSFQSAPEALRRPFFLIVSLIALGFIISLYLKLLPTQKALKWGLPLVFGGALGNLSDRLTRTHVVDFIDYRADWVLSMNEFIQSFYSSWAVSDHWPTFNIADVAICVGVTLMAIDMFTHRRDAGIQKKAKTKEASSAV
ncbi:MAG: signal peptidase II [Polyangiaceae bacterium]|nr:signal peptidase II [Polyangiaceae bacterium]